MDHRKYWQIPYKMFSWLHYQRSRTMDKNSIHSRTNFATSHKWPHSAWDRKGRNREKGEEPKENRGDHSTIAHGPPQQWVNANNAKINRTGSKTKFNQTPSDDWPTPEILNKKLRQATYVENVVNIHKSLNASFSLYIYIYSIQILKGMKKSKSNWREKCGWG